MSSPEFDLISASLLAVPGSQYVSPDEPPNRFLPPQNADVGRFALGNARSVVPRKGMSEPTNPKEDVVDQDKDRSERDPHLVGTPPVRIRNREGARKTHNPYPSWGQMDSTE